MFYVRDNRVECSAQNIGRDYLGSITHIATEDGTLLAEYSYDPWGRMRNPQTHVLYAGGTEPELLLGRGYTGHEHLKQFGLINMNARLYDPYLGRFLSPDPYVQAPDFSQNFNRYSYALNNPLKYTDESGEFLGTILTALLRLPVAFIEGIIASLFESLSDTEKAGEMFENAWQDYGNRVSRAFEIDKGLFQTDPNLNPVENALSLLSRFTWEIGQTLLGNMLAHVRNNFFEVNVEHYNGATLVNRNGGKDKQGLTLGSYINGNYLVADPAKDSIFAHEYGHTKQSKILGPLYLPIVGVPSLVGSIFDYELYLSDHNREWYEVWANQLSYNYHDRHNLSSVTSSWNDKENPRVQHVDWYFYLTLGYYIALPLLFVL